MIERIGRRARHAIQHPGWIVCALNRRFDWQRRLGLEPSEFTRLADEVLLTGRIEGWRFRQDLGLLYLLARDTPGPGVTVEIGSYKGLGTTALAFGVRHGGRQKVHTVDPHTGDRQDLEQHGVQASSAADLERNIAEAGIGDEVIAYTMTSNELASGWTGERIRVLFIDGWHSYEAVSSDIRNWVPLLTPEGVVLIDDYRNYEELRAAVDDAGDLLPPHRRTVGRMRLAHRQPLPSSVERYLRIRWW